MKLAIIVALAAFALGGCYGGPNDLGLYEAPVSLARSDGGDAQAQAPCGKPSGEAAPPCTSGSEMACGGNGSGCRRACLGGQWQPCVCGNVYDTCEQVGLHEQCDSGCFRVCKPDMTWSSCGC